MAPRGMWWVPAPSFFPWWLAENKMLPLLCAVMSHTSTDPKQSSQPILDWNLQNCEPKSLPPPLSHLGTLGNKHPIKAAIRLTTGKEKKSIIVAQLSSSSPSNLLALQISVTPSATEQEHPAILPLSTGHSQCLNSSVPPRLLVHRYEVFRAAVLVLRHFIDCLFLGFNQMVWLNVKKRKKKSCFCK